MPLAGLSTVRSGRRASPSATRRRRCWRRCCRTSSFSKRAPCGCTRAAYVSTQYAPQWFVYGFTCALCVNNAADSRVLVHGSPCSRTRRAPRWTRCSRSATPTTARSLNSSPSRLVSSLGNLHSQRSSKLITHSVQLIQHKLVGTLKRTGGPSKVRPSLSLREIPAQVEQIYQTATGPIERSACR